MHWIRKCKPFRFLLPVAIPQFGDIFHMDEMFGVNYGKAFAGSPGAEILEYYKKSVFVNYKT